VTESSKEDDADFIPWFSQERCGGSILQPVDPWTTVPSDSLHYWVRFRVLTASMKIFVFWDVTPCSLVEIYRRFRAPRNNDGVS
jgi:hypothetical protein